MDCNLVLSSAEAFEVCKVFLELSQNNFLQSYGVFGLFFNALLAATALPLPTEILVSTLLNGGEPEYLIIIALVAGGGLGGIVNYGIGFGGSGVFRKLKPKKNKEKEKKENKIKKVKKEHKLLNKLKKLGWVGIFVSAWIPILGDVALMSAGAKKMHFRKYIVVMVAGKAFRSIVVVLGLSAIF